MTVAASMRRPASVNGRASRFVGIRRRPTGGMIRPRPWPPFPHIRWRFFGREKICQGRPGLPAQRTLDRFFPFRTIKAEGKGAGGLRGLVPLAEYEAAPHARGSAPSLSHLPVLSWIFHRSETAICPIAFPARSIATLPSALVGGCHRGAHWCS